MASRTVRDLAESIQRIAPPELAESWDNVGLLVGRADRALEGPVVLTIDLTEAVLTEAIGAKAAAIVAYHPPVWEPLRRLSGASVRGRILLGAIEAGIAILSPHTALDAVSGGVTDWLCEGISGGEPGRIAGDCRALRPHTRRDESREVKLVTFVPGDHLDAVRKALASAGAGIIGEYQVCSFASAGTGTFLGGKNTKPAVGEAGRLESVAEFRLEMVCSKAAVPLALETLRRFHPYEEPAVDVYELLGLPERHAGAGRRLVLDRPATLAEIARRLKDHLGVSMVKVAQAPGQSGELSRVGVCPGSGASLAEDALADGCEVFITGEMKHHEVLGALQAGMSVILGGHTNTERGYLPRLGAQIERLLPGVRTIVSREDRGLFEAL